MEKHHNHQQPPNTDHSPSFSSDHPTDSTHIRASLPLPLSEMCNPDPKRFPHAVVVPGSGLTCYLSKNSVTMPDLTAAWCSPSSMLVSAWPRSQIATSSFTHKVDINVSVSIRMKRRLLIVKEAARFRRNPRRWPDPLRRCCRTKFACNAPDGTREKRGTW